MRFLLLAASASLVLTGTAMAAQKHHHQHQQHAQPAAPVADGAVPADVLSAHDLYIRNLHDSGYNPATDTATN